MHVAIVNNSAFSPDNIISLLKENTYEIFDYSRANEIDCKKFDLLILSGSSQFPVEFNKEKLTAEISLIQSCAIPIVGICYGCELITVAFGGTLKDRGEGTQERVPFQINVLVDDPIFLGRKDFVAYDAHRWIVDQTSPVLQVLAESIHSPEVVRHTKYPIYGFQFHPEKMQDKTFGDEIFEAFVNQYVTG